MYLTVTKHGKVVLKFSPLRTIFNYIKENGDANLRYFIRFKELSKDDFMALFLKHEAKDFKEYFELEKNTSKFVGFNLNNDLRFSKL